MKRRTENGPPFPYFNANYLFWLVLLTAGFSSFLFTPSVVALLSGLFTSGDVFALGVPFTGDVLGLATGVVAGVELTTAGLFSGLFSVDVPLQAPVIAVAAARIVARTICLLIDLFLNLSKTPES
jgi:hypothetical protein